MLLKAHRVSVPGRSFTLIHNSKGCVLLIDISSLVTKISVSTAFDLDIRLARAYLSSFAVECKMKHQTFLR